MISTCVPGVSKKSSYSEKETYLTMGTFFETPGNLTLLQTRYKFSITAFRKLDHIWHFLVVNFIPKKSQKHTIVGLRITK